MNEKLLHRFEFMWQAQAVAEVLDQESIDYELIKVPREYAAILVGGNSDRVDLFVKEVDFDKAKVIWARVSSGGGPSLLDNDASESPGRNNFKRVILFSMMGIVFLPIVMNWAATLNYFELRKQNIAAGKMVLVHLVLWICWLVALLESFYLFNRFIGRL